MQTIYVLALCYRHLTNKGETKQKYQSRESPALFGDVLGLFGESPLVRIAHTYTCVAA